MNNVERKKWVKKAFGMSKSGGKNSIAHAAVAQRTRKPTDVMFKC